MERETGKKRERERYGERDGGKKSKQKRNKEIEREKL